MLLVCYKYKSESGLSPTTVGNICPEKLRQRLVTPITVGIFEKLSYSKPSPTFTTQSAVVPLLIVRIEIVNLHAGEMLVDYFPVDRRNLHSHPTMMKCMPLSSICGGLTSVRLRYRLIK